MEKTMSIKELFSEIGKKWKLLVLAAIIGAIAFNIYGYSKAQAAESAREELHKRYETAAPELPGYYTEDLFALRDSLSDIDVKFTLAYAKIYREFIKEYGTETDTSDNTNLESYMLFLNSYKDMKSNMSSTQRAFFNALRETDTESYLDSHPEVESFVPHTPGIIQLKYLLIGFVLGGIFAAAIIAVPVVNRKCR